jgi:hypothetical protein
LIRRADHPTVRVSRGFELTPLSANPVEVRRAIATNAEVVEPHAGTVTDLGPAPGVRIVVERSCSMSR